MNRGVALMPEFYDQESELAPDKELRAKVDDAIGNAKQFLKNVLPGNEIQVLSPLESQIRSQLVAGCRTDALGRSRKPKTSPTLGRFRRTLMRASWGMQVPIAVKSVDRLQIPKPVAAARFLGNFVDSGVKMRTLASNKGFGGHFASKDLPVGIGIRSSKNDDFAIKS